MSVKSYIELTKPRITLLILCTTTLGYYLGGNGQASGVVWLFLMVGAALVCSGSAVMNHYLERDCDAKMLRTQNRPLPSGAIAPLNALQFGIVLILAGLFVLYVKVNVLTAFLSLLTAFLYVLVYTPMKRLSWFNTTVGAVPGGIPVLGGWSAAAGTLNSDAGILFLILFIWQHPHFYAIAWMFREDYKRGGFQMLPCIEEDGRRTFRQVQLYSLALIPVSLIPYVTGLSGRFYLIGAFAVGVALYRVSHMFIRLQSVDSARDLLKATVIYFPVLLGLIVIDKVWFYAS